MEYLLFLQELRNAAPDALNLFLFYVTELMAGALPIAIGVVIFWCIDKKGGYLVMSCYIACTAINQIVKNIACVYRPWILDPRIQTYPAALPGATGYSFPSGHTAIAVGFFGGLALWARDAAKEKGRKAPVLLIAILVIAALLVGFTRNWLGCHSLQDVLCSLVIATVTMLTTSWVLKKVDEKPHYDLIASAVFLVASIAFTVFCALKSYPLDYDALGNLLVDPQNMVADCFKAFGVLFGISIAWPIERHFIKFTVDGTVKQRVLRGVVGCLFLAAAYAVGKFVLPLVLGADLGRFFEYALLVVTAVAIYPALFTWWKKRRVK